MRITDLIDKKSINLNLKSTNKSDVINELVELMNHSENLKNKEEYKKAILAREELSTTGIGEGIAIPHAKTTAVKKASLATGISKDGIDYEAFDGSLANLFFMIAFLKAVSNLHQNITLEMVIEAMVKVVVANVLYLNILNIMTTIFSISSAMAKEVFTIDAPDLKVEDMDIGSALFYQLFGLLFILAAIVCSFLMLWTVYSRYIKLYLLMILAPFAMSALVGGQEIERSFYAWMRTFLLNAFEIVVIALTMVISFK